MGSGRFVMASMVVVAWVGGTAGDAVAAATTVRVTVSSLGVQANGRSTNPAVSADGRFVAFASLASNLVAGDTNGTWDVFVRDLVAGTTTRVSVSSSEQQGNGSSGHVRPPRARTTRPMVVAISARGRFVAFMSQASNLVSGDTNRTADVFVRDRARGVTHRVSVSTGGRQADHAIIDLDLSAHGRWVVFSTRARNLLRHRDRGRLIDVFERDLANGETRQVDVGSGERPARANCFSPSVSDRGQRIAFLCEQAAFPSDLAVIPASNHYDVWHRNQRAGLTKQINVSHGHELAGTSDTGANTPSINDDSGVVTFAVPGQGGLTQIWTRNPSHHTTGLVSQALGGGEGDAASANPTISRSGRYVAFLSCADDLIPADTTGPTNCGPIDIFFRDRLTKTTTRVGLTNGGVPPTTGLNSLPVLNDPGTWIVFESTASDLTNGDTNNQPDIFARGPLH